VTSDQIRAPSGPAVARQIGAPALVGLITAIAIDAIGNAPTLIQLVVPTGLGSAVWWLHATRPAAQAAPPALSRRRVRIALLVAAAIALVGVGLVAGLAIEWRRTALVLTAWLLAVAAVLLLLPKIPRPASRLAVPLTAAGIGCAIGLTVFELSVIGRFAFFPPQPALSTVPRQLSTPDGLVYRMRAIGDFPLVETADDRFKVHVRWATREGADKTHIATTRAAVRIADVVVSVTGTQPGRVGLNGRTTVVPPEGLRTGPVTVRSAGARIEVGADRLRVAFTLEGGVVSRIDLTIPGAYRGQLRGLFGNFDDNPADDLRLHDGTLIRHGGEPGAVQDVIDGRFARSWRLRPEQGLLG
jgi:von Willebrand factor type D domain